MQAFTLKLREQGFLCYDNLRVILDIVSRHHQAIQKMLRLQSIGQMDVTYYFCTIEMGSCKFFF